MTESPYAHNAYRRDRGTRTRAAGAGAGAAPARRHSRLIVPTCV